MADDESTYLSYLLRLWRGADKERPVWHASLEHPISGERRGFSSLEALFTFLRRACAPEPDDDADVK